MKHTSLMSSLVHAFQIPLRVSIAPASNASSLRPIQQSSSFSTTLPAMARRNKNAPKIDSRITMLRYALYHPYTLVPRPLRFSRLRTLRHWTIQRAWSLYSGQKRQQQQLELERQWNSMRAACEELRTEAGDGGRLYRQAMSKKGTWGGRSDLGIVEDAEGNALPGEKGRVPRGMETGIPIEYGRGLTDSPPRDGWDSEWTR